MRLRIRIPGCGRSGRRNRCSRCRCCCCCADTFHFPCADTVEPAVLPLTCVDVERYRQLFTHLDIELFYFICSEYVETHLAGILSVSSITYSCAFHSLPDALETPPLGWSIAMIFPVNSIVLFLNDAAKLQFFRDMRRINGCFFFAVGNSFFNFVR